MRKQLLAAGLGLFVVVSLVVAACGGGQTPSPTPPRPTPTSPAAATSTAAPTSTSAAATATVPSSATPTPRPTATVPSASTPTSSTSAPKPGGTLRVRMYLEQTPDLYASAGFGSVDWGPVFNQVIQQNPYDQSKIIGDLAQTWSVSSDGAVYTLNLVKNATWHDGSPFNADDIVYSMNRAIFPAAGVRSTISNSFGDVAKIEKVDDFTVKVTLKFPSAAFLSNLTTVGFVVYPQRLTMDQVTANPVGTGPFKFKSKTAGVSMDLVRNDSYFKPGLPYLDGIKFFLVTDDTSAFAAFQTRQLDVSGPTISIFRTIPVAQRVLDGAKVNLYNGGAIMIMFKDVAPYTDINVRQAFNLAMDRQQYIDTVFTGGGLANGGIMMPERFGGLWANSEKDYAAMPGYRQPKDADIAQAKKLMEAAGFTASNPLKPLTPFANFNTVDMQVIAAQWDKINVKLNFKIVQSAVLTQDAIAGNYDVLPQGLLQSVDDPSQDIAQLLLPSSLRRYHSITDDQVATLYNQQARTLDPAARRQITQQLEKYVLFDKVYVMTPGWQMQPEIILNTVQNIPLRRQFYSNVNRHEQTWLLR